MLRIGCDFLVRKDIDIAQALAVGIERSLPVAELSRRLMDGVTVISIEQLPTDR
jgi:hypothetical protein